MAGFGFTPPDEPIDPNQNPNQNPNPFGNFGEIFQQFSSMGLNLQGLISALSGRSLQLLSLAK